jgi:hypothetical protein
MITPYVITVENKIYDTSQSSKLPEKRNLGRYNVPPIIITNTGIVVNTGILGITNTIRVVNKIEIKSSNVGAYEYLIGVVPLNTEINAFA